MSQRRYRGKQSRPIPVWNGVLEHRQRIDAAIWAFLWLLDGITDERDGFGIVLGGAPVKAKRMAADLAFDERTVREHLDTLEANRYIRRRRTPYGYVFEVCNSRKFGIWRAHKRSEENTRSVDERSEEIPGQIGRNPPSRPEEIFRYKEDAAKGTQQKDAAAARRPAFTPNPEDSVWESLKISPCGPISFRTLLESRWASRNGDRPSVVIGETVDAWETAEGRKLGVPVLFRSLAELRRQERGNDAVRKAGVDSQPIHVLSSEEIPA